MIYLYTQKTLKVINEEIKRICLSAIFWFVLNCFTELFSVNSAKVTLILGQILKITHNFSISSNQIHYTYKDSLWILFSMPSVTSQLKKQCNINETKLEKSSMQK